MSIRRVLVLVLAAAGMAIAGWVLDKAIMATPERYTPVGGPPGSSGGVRGSRGGA